LNSVALYKIKAMVETKLPDVELIASVLKESIPEDETNRRLSKPVMKALRNAGLHSLYLPASFGGLELDPVTVAHLVEDVSRYNTAAGWSMMVANVSAWWCSMFSREGAELIFGKDPSVMIAGAVHPPMIAARVKDGFRITGRNPLASNVHEASWVFVTAMIFENGAPKMNNGMPEVVGVMMKSSDIEIHDTWHTIGMKATDSCDIEAKEVFVPTELSFPLRPDFTPNEYFQGPLYKFSAIGASVVALIAPVALAVARNAIEELKLIACKKVSFASTVTMRERGVMQRKIGMAEALVQSSRTFLYDTLKKYWTKTLKEEALTLEDKANLLLAATHTNQSCVQAVDLVYSASGTSGIYTRNRLSHYFTDAQVIRQHGFLNDSRYETAAQVFLGVPHDLPMLGF
jgi:indole-3-acetate monooxygenase